MKRYHVHALGKVTVIECDGMDYSSAGYYRFWNYKKSESDDVFTNSVLKEIENLAYYPIMSTVISKIETKED